MQLMRLLLIEDDTDIGEAIVEGLEGQGYAVSWEKDGEMGLYQAREFDWELIILDRMLPGVDGIQILKSLRREKSVPVLMLTALDQVDHRLEGFDQGADDYLGKPFELRELYARVRALARRAYGQQDARMMIGELIIDLEKKRTYMAEREIELTPSEFQTLEFMVLRRGRIITRRQLEDLLGQDERDIQANALDVHMHRLRSKVGSSLIQTKRGKGYLIPDEPKQE